MPNFKEAAIESPSDKEKAHINEEEQSIDTPVVENNLRKRIKCCKEANIMYDDRVKMAYDEIVGEDFDKEAGVKDIAGKAWGGIKGAPGKAWGAMKGAPGKAWGGIKGAAGAAGRTYSGRNVRNAKMNLKNINDLLNDSGLTSDDLDLSHIGGVEGLKKSLRNAQIQRGLAYGIPAAAALGGAAVAGKKLYDRHKSKAEEQAEKAAAYYDEAQYAKEAAIDDYNEACAYEEAALTILDELGYLD